MQTTKSCSHAKFWVVIVALVGILGFSLLLNAGLKVGLLVRHRPAKERGMGTDEYPQFTERHSYGKGDVKAVRIELTGVITRAREAGPFGGSVDMTESILRQIRAAQNDDDVRAIILEVDSPGGEITPTDEIYRALKEFRGSSDERRVVVFIRDLAASGCYYASMAADAIIAEPTAMIGSISVIMQTLNWRTLSEKIGIEDVTIASGRNKDLLNPFREVNPEHVKMLQQIIDQLHARFADVVREGRSLEAGAVASIADGSVFSANDAVAKKLIDSIGDWDDAVARTAKLLGERSVRVVRYERHVRLADLFSQVEGPMEPLNRLGRLLPSTRGPRFLYLWQP